MTLEIDGMDMTPYIAYGGLKWQRSDVDGPNAGRSMSAITIRDRIAMKVRLDVTCRPLELKEASIVLKAIEPEFVQVRYTDPQEGREINKTMYSNNIPAQFLIRQPDGRELWGGITFPLVER